MECRVDSSVLKSDGMNNGQTRFMICQKRDVVFMHTICQVNQPPFFLGLAHYYEEEHRFQCINCYENSSVLNVEMT